MNHKDYNAVRLDRVTDKQWREALDELTVYLNWRLAGKTKRGAHSEKELGMPALDYYTEEAVLKLIEGEWKWQDRFTLGKQLEKIAADLVTKQVQKWKREHPWLNENEDENHEEQFAQRKPELIEFTDDMEQFAGVMDDDDQEELDETYNLVYALVEDDDELYAFVGAIESCGSFKDLPEFMHCDAKRVYRLMEKLMRRIRSAKKHGLI